VTSSFGVKRICLLNDLQYFNVSDNYAVDIMHDILEGVGHFLGTSQTIKSYPNVRPLKEYTRTTMDILNERIVPAE